MDKSQSGLIIALLILSVVILILPVVIIGVWAKNKDKFNKSRLNSAVTRMVVTYVCLLGSVWSLRYAVGYFSIISSVGGEATLTWLEEIVNSLLHALQTFSMDEDYTGYILNGKEMLTAIFGENSYWPTVYGAYASFLNFVAPIAGGAIIFEIIASIFPTVKLWLLNFVFCKDKYYFSQLNEGSLALAKSIRGLNAPLTKRPVLVFAHVLPDDSDEKSAELLQQAKLLGAICLKTDLALIKKNRLGKRKFFLINENESENLQLLTRLSDSVNNEYLKKSEIYLFTNDDAYLQIEKNTRDKLIADLGFSEEEQPVFIPVKNYRNLISNLLVDVPLYEPLVNKKPNKRGEKDLSVTILGTGKIGREMFLSTYWFGQILSCKLKINVISQETEDEFWNSIDYVNPEIKRTTVKNDKILTVNRAGDVAPTYCTVKYLQCDVKSSQFVQMLTDARKRILDTDYFFVSLGCDEDNISVANTIRKYLCQHVITSGAAKDTVITYVVYDSELSEILNRNKLFSFAQNSGNVFVQAVGSLKEVYSVKNVFLTEHEDTAQKNHEAYLSAQNNAQRAKTHKKRMDDDYKHWANLARAMHVKYKAFSMGLVKKSLFECVSENEYKAEAKRAVEEYKKIASGKIEFATSKEEKEHLKLLNNMAWLEHRRWCAFTRVKGFRGTSAYANYAKEDVSGSYKQMDIKLHPCLVECDNKGIKAELTSQGIIDASTSLKCTDKDKFDLLDDLSYDLFEKNLNDYDFKLYDYPIFDV
ncbi:MAG: hypothetical protein IKB86_03595 [Clostridia bacterium]|nr:hypothetical protein [Clostridia bacterium]